MLRGPGRGVAVRAERARGPRRVRRRGGDGAQRRVGVRVVARRDPPALAFSGGGARAFTLALGWTRALKALDLWPASGLLAAVSGGGWFFGPHYYGDDAAADLGATTPPEALTLAALEASATPKLFSAPGAILKTCVELLAERAVYSHKPLDEIWRDAIFASYLEPFGVGSHQPFFASDGAAKAAVARNPALYGGESAPLAPRSPSPTLVLGGSVEGPADLVPLQKKIYLPLALGADATGSPSAVRVHYAKRGGGGNETLAVGGLQETWALRRRAPPRGGAQRIFGAGGAGDGTTTGAAAATLSNLVPTKRLWAPPSLALPPYFVLGDGGDVENFGLVQLLQRGATRAVVFDATLSPLAPRTQWDPAARAPTAADVDEYVPALFGMDVGRDLEAELSHNHVFDARGFAPLCLALQDAAARGTGAVASASVVTVRNDLFGVEAGRSVDLTLVYLDLPSKWLAALPSETRKAIKKGDDFPNFPFYDTFTQLALAPVQVALLAHMASWVIEQNADLLREKLASESA
ncbi:hypothetical protein JL722_12862 [Aureococcus anophagefferens]|nr:hypothetical protein JL722_12862 [Aureococcus anophagefferens]